MVSKKFPVFLLFSILIFFVAGCDELPFFDAPSGEELTVSLSTLTVSPTNEDSVEVLVSFSSDVEGLSFSDFTVENGTVTALTGSGSDYTVTLEPTADGTVQITLPENSATSSADGTGNSESFLTIVFDRTAPSAPVIEGISDGTYSSIQTFTLSGIESNADAEYSIDGGALWNDYLGATEIILEGSYVITARQQDEAGNISGSAASISITMAATYQLSITIMPHGTIEIDSVSYSSADSPYFDNKITGSVVEISVTDHDFGYGGCTWTGTDAAALSGTYPNYSIVIDDDKQLTAGFDFADDMLFVSKSGNDTTGTGSIEEPYLTVATAASAASAGSTVFVSEGSYTETVTVTEAVSFYGGYNPLDWSIRDADVYETVLNNVSGPALLLNSGSITTDVTVDGFTITGGLHCNDGAYPVISNNDITGIAGTLTGAIRCIDSGAVIYNNIIDGGSGADYATAGILLMNSSGEIYNNTISGGGAEDTSTAIGLQSSTANVEIHHNYIEPGSASLGSNGIDIYQSSNINIYNNVIYGGGSHSTNNGVQIQESPGCVVQNNTIDGGINGSAANYGIREVYAGEGSVMTNNLIFFTGGGTKIGINSDSTSVTYNSVWDCQDPGGYDGVDGNTVNPADPLLGGATGMEPVSTSFVVLLAETGTTIPSITDDINGAPRTVPYFPGAFEYDP